MKILFLISHLGYSGAAKQLLRLAQGLQSQGIDLMVGATTAGPVSQTLTEAGIGVRHFGRRSFDVGAYLAARRTVLDYQPDLIHVWQLRAYQALRLCMPRLAAPVVLSKPFAGGCRWDRMPLLHQWLIRSTAAVVAYDQTEANALRALGVAGNRIHLVPPAVDVVPVPGRQDQSGDGPLVNCMGPLEVHKCHMDAVWSMDIMRFLFPSMQMHIIGDGPDIQRVRDFAVTTRLQDQIHFLGPREDGRDLLAKCDVVWIPSRRPGGINTALEAMAAGVPVVATRLPGLTEVVEDGVTGFLIPPGEQRAIARKTRLLFDDASLRRRMGEAGRERVRAHFGVPAMVERFVSVYEGIRKTS